MLVVKGGDSNYRDVAEKVCPEVMQLLQGGEQLGSRAVLAAAFSRPVIKLQLEFLQLRSASLAMMTRSAAAALRQRRWSRAKHRRWTPRSPPLSSSVNRHPCHLLCPFSDTSSNHTWQAGRAAGHAGARPNRPTAGGEGAWWRCGFGAATVSPLECHQAEPAADSLATAVGIAQVRHS